MPFATVPVGGTGDRQDWIRVPAATADPTPAGIHAQYAAFTTDKGGNFVSLNRLGMGGGWVCGGCPARRQE